MSGSRSLGRWGGAAVLASLLLFPLDAADARGQEAAPPEGWTVDGRAGVAAAVGELRDLTDPGPAVGLGVAYWFTPSVSLRADVDADFYASEEPWGPLQEEGPQFRLWHTTAGVLMRFTSERVPRWTTLLGVGAGATTFDTDSFLIPVSGEARSFEFGDTYFTTYAHFRIGYELNARARLSVGVRPHLIVADEDDTEVFEVATDGRTSAFGTVGTIPVFVGLSYGI